MMNDKQKRDFIESSISTAVDMINKLGDIKKYAEKFRGCFADGLSDLPDSDVIFITGFMAGAQAVLEEISGDLEEMSEADKQREMFTVRDVGRG
jgi:hypothetical protein